MSTSTSSRRRADALARRDAVRREARLGRVVKQVGALVMSLLLVAIVTVVVLASRAGEAPVVDGASVAPVGVSTSGALSIGRPDAPVTVSVFFDYMCPFCGRFEAVNSDELDRLVASGTIRLELHPLSFLDAQSDGTSFSTRTANAVATVADGAPDQVWGFHRAVFEQQPAEGTTGLTDGQLEQLARGAGVPDDVLGRFEDRTFFPWVAEATQQALDSGVTGTPTVLVDGTVFDGDLYTAGPLTEAVEAAAVAR